jgi:hypothetical protein
MKAKVKAAKKALRFPRLPIKTKVKAGMGRINSL